MVVVPSLFQLVIDLLIVLRQLEVGLQVSICQNHWHKSVFINIGHFVLLLDDVGNHDTGTGGGGIFVFLVGEDVDSDNCGFGRSMLSGFGCRVIDHFAGKSFDQAISSFLNISSCGWSAVWCSCISFLKGVLLVRHLLNQLIMMVKIEFFD